MLNELFSSSNLQIHNKVISNSTFLTSGELQIFTTRVTRVEGFYIYLPRQDKNSDIFCVYQTTEEVHKIFRHTTKEIEANKFAIKKAARQLICGAEAKVGGIIRFVFWHVFNSGSSPEVIFFFLHIFFLQFKPGKFGKIFEFILIKISLKYCFFLYFINGNFFSV